MRFSNFKWNERFTLPPTHKSTKLGLDGIVYSKCTNSHGLIVSVPKTAPARVRRYMDEVRRFKPGRQCIPVMTA